MYNSSPARLFTSTLSGLSLVTLTSIGLLLDIKTPLAISLRTEFTDKTIIIANATFTNMDTMLIQLLADNWKEESGFILL
jgi:hypothetical protein